MSELIYGADSNKDVHPVRVTNTGEIVIASLPAGNNNIGDVDVTSLPPLPAGNNNIGDVDVASIAPGSNRIGSVGLEGWIGATWRKNPMLIGYGDTTQDSILNTNLSAGTVSLYGTTVPANEIWIITNIAGQYIGTVTSVFIYIRKYDASVATSRVLYDMNPVVSGRFVDRQGWWILKPGDSLQATIFNATDGDDFRLDAVGFKFRTDQ